jgi:hypothetical protein
VYMAIFKKVQRDANRFFHKVDQGASKFFNKTIPGVAKQAGAKLEDFGGDIAKGATKVGNFLEKNAGIISDGVGGALMATGYGAPLGEAVMAAGNSAQQLGGQIKRTGKNAQRDINQFSQVAQGKAQGLANQGLHLTNKATGQASNALNQTIQRINDAGNQALESTMPAVV